MTHDTDSSTHQDTPQATPPTTFTSPRDGHPQPCVVLVEQDDPLALALNIWLTGQGYTCVHLRDARTVYDTLLSTQHTLVLLDATLPDNAGYQLCQDIRTDPTLSHIPIVLMTPCGKALEQRKAHALGATCLLTKPFHLHELAAALNDIVPSYP